MEAGSTSKKSYLSQQIKLIGMTTSDLFTDEEYELYIKIVNLIKATDTEQKILKNKSEMRDPTIKQSLIEEKTEVQQQLASLIAKHAGTPRLVSTKRLVDTRKLEKDDEDKPIYPKGISWFTLKTSRKIQEFMSECTRSMGYQENDVCFNKIIIKWKSLDILKQIVLDGFDMDLELEDGSVERRHYVFMTASAGQLRTDKVQFIEESTWNKIKMRLMCGLTFEEINKKKGINITKLEAYLALPSSATDAWPEMDIDRTIVIDDFEAPVEGVVDYINNEYKMSRLSMETVIKHTDGCGMMLPRVSRKNFMVRGPWIKGLLTSFDYIKFCKVHNIEPVLKDIYGKVHNLVEENIDVVFTKSQFKLYGYYDSWDDYKERFKKYGCTLNRANFEEDYIPDTNINYQMLQTLTDMTDEEIKTFTNKTYNKIKKLLSSEQAMLQALQAHDKAGDPYRRSLAIYPELLRDGYSRATLKAIKLKMILDARSGRIKCENKRLFAIPDMYAACQYWFLGQPRPEGLLKNGEVSCKPLITKDKVDCLRSPHLYMEHAIRNIVHDQEIYNWFYTDGIYTSCHDLISKILQFDVDGDMLNAVTEPVIVDCAERMIKEREIVPLLYELGKADPSMVTKEEMYNGVKRAHDYSGIGQVSNSLTKLWNKPDPDLYSAACLTFFNNLVIDAAKTGFLNTYENYPEVKERIRKAIGGTRGRMPFFFQYSINGRSGLHLPASERKHYAKTTSSTMNRICARFDDIGNLNMSAANVPPFNWQMLLSNKCTDYKPEAVKIFCDFDDGNIQNIAYAYTKKASLVEIESLMGYEFIKDDIIHELNAKVGTLEECYPSIVKYLFAGQNANKQSHKRMFWRVFGDIACRILEENLKTYTVCEKCGQKIPAWATRHSCPKDAIGFFECADCGAWVKRVNGRQVRCESCQVEFKKITNRALKRRSYKSRKAA